GVRPLGPRLPTTSTQSMMPSQRSPRRQPTPCVTGLDRRVPQRLHEGAAILRPSVNTSSWRERALVLAGFALLAVAATWPLALHPGSVGYEITSNFDAQFSVWNVAWVARTLVTDPLHVFNANIFYPHHWTLAYSEANLAAGAFAAPVYWLTKSPY